MNRAASLLGRPAPLRVLDLFAGLRGWSQPFADRGHEVFAVELDPRFPADHRDVFDYEPPAGYFDLVLASPVCTGFSVMQIGRNWTKDHQPKTDRARLSLSMVERTRYIIAKAAPRLGFIIENPRAKLRKLPVVADLPRVTVTYCQYGETRMKPTDLWGRFPSGLTFKPPCTNGASCHVAAPRGSTTGTQGMDSAESARIPYALALSVCLAAEAAL